MPWKKRSLYTGQEQEEVGEGAEGNGVFEGQDIKGVPNFTCIIIMSTHLTEYHPAQRRRFASV